VTSDPASAGRPILFIFLDGVGLGADDPARNAFVVARLPTLDALLDGRRVVAAIAPLHTSRASLVALDATLGVDGLPQSGTGHATLFTGEDAVRMHGRHFGPWVPARLRGFLRERSVLAKARAAGLRVAFANAYPLDIIEADRRALREGGRPRLLRAGPPLAADGAGVLTRGPEHLAAGAAVASEITNDRWAERVGTAVAPPIMAHEAGRNLAAIAAACDLTLFAHYGTDHAGHERSLESAVAALEKVDAFLGGVIDAAARDMLLVVASDHGNVEDCTTAHTLNPALGLVVGTGHAAFARRLASIADVAPAILDALNEEQTEAPDRRGA